MFDHRWSDQHWSYFFDVKAQNTTSKKGANFCYFEVLKKYENSSNSCNYKIKNKSLQTKTQ
jgi:hypothetical protein